MVQFEVPFGGSDLDLCLEVSSYETTGLLLSGTIPMSSRARPIGDIRPYYRKENQVHPVGHLGRIP